MEVVRLGDVVRVRHGGTPSKDNTGFWQGSIPWVSPKDFDRSQFRALQDFITEDAIAKSAASIVPPGTVLAVARSGVLAHSFPVALTDRPVSFNQDIKALIPDMSRLDPRYLHHWLRAAEGVVVRQGVKRGATVHSLSAGFLESMTLRLPPLAEQRRIVDILDRAAGIRRLRRQAQDTARLIIPALFNKMFGDPATNPMGWPVVGMGTIFREPSRYGTMTPASDEQGNFLCIRVANIQNGELSFRSQKYVDGASLNRSRHVLSDGDLVLARAIASRELLGKCVVVYPGEQNWAFDSHIMLCRFNEKLALPEYVSAFLKSSGGRQEFLSHTRNSAVQFNINAKEMAAVKVPLPPLALQRRFDRTIRELKKLSAIQASGEDACEAAAAAIQSRILG